MTLRVRSVMGNDSTSGSCGQAHTALGAAKTASLRCFHDEQTCHSERKKICVRVNARGKLGSFSANDKPASRCSTALTKGSGKGKEKQKTQGPISCGHQKRTLSKSRETHTAVLLGIHLVPDCVYIWSHYVPLQMTGFA